MSPKSEPFSYFSSLPLKNLSLTSRLGRSFFPISNSVRVLGSDLYRLLNIFTLCRLLLFLTLGSHPKYLLYYYYEVNWCFPFYIMAEVLLFRENTFRTLISRPLNFYGVYLLSHETKDPRRWSLIGKEKL